MSGRNTTAAPRAKRRGSDLSRQVDQYLHHEISEPSSKKPRFDYRNPSTLAPDAPEEDAILELDEIGKAGQQTKRNAVNLDGFESDSSNENFEARAEERAKRQKRTGAEPKMKSRDEDGNDMFADLDENFKDADEDEDLAREGKKRKKDVRFMDEGDIEGQIASSKSGGHISANLIVKGKGRAAEDEERESSSDESGGDEARDMLEDGMDEELGAGSKKRHAPRVDAFNMKEENEEGRFDESGNYIRRAADPDAVHDIWLEGLSKKDVRRAREAQEKREAARRKRDRQDDEMLMGDILARLIERMEKGETVLEALQRLGKGEDKGKAKGKTRKGQSWQKTKRRNGVDMDIDVEQALDNPEDTRRKEAVEIVTGAADQLLTRGQTDIYDQEREVLMRQYKKETGEDWTDTLQVLGNGSDKFEYRWSDARDGGERHGPYDGATMAAWNEAGYFGEGVEFRRVGDMEWSRSIDFR